MSFETTAEVDFLLSYLSEIHNKSLALYELVTSKPKTSRQRAALTINELFTLYNSAKVFYFSTPAVAKPEVNSFFEAFEDYYFELKQVFLNEDNNTALLYHKLTSMKEYFEALTDSYKVL